MKLNSTTFRLWTLAALTLPGCLATFAQSTNRLDPHKFASFQLLSDRNIFDPNRRPSRPYLRTNPPPVYSFSLVGTMNYDKGIYATFNGTSEEYYKTLQSGDRIAVYTVSDITYDSCKLTHGTNEVELKVGMQMRRNTDGSWSVSQQVGESAYAFNGNSRFGNSSRFNRFDRNNGGDRNDRRFNGGSFSRNNSRNNDRSYGFGGNDSNMGSAAGGGMDSGGGPAAVSSGSSDPNDVVARLMAARAAQLGQNPGQNEGGNQPPDQNFQGPNENENPNGNQDFPNENQGGPPNGNPMNPNLNQNGNEPGAPR